MHKLFPALVSVKDKQLNIMFSFIIHFSDNTKQRKIDDIFYLNYSLDKKVPEGPHHEIKISFPDVTLQKNKEKIHFYKSNKDEGNLYICWTAPVPDIKQAVSILKMWSIGTAYTIKYGEGFEKFFTEDELATISFDRGLELIKQNYEIEAEVIYPLVK